ncbi:arylsulfatase [Ginsengibacter hankyongi]|uniref:Arylsulfatase n=1 Tax=Ginsengibacter hankyongi TaxID=2607284 RepID=A0A5J5IK61_9BACT|nr:arylsulfatase [Ginsengibacter hankyongi]KAA9041191.1 arylsulfatase [Ginsengibacter hankyongi]
MIKRKNLLCVLLIFAYSCHQKDRDSTTVSKEERLPNIVYILADDLGYGDVSIYNPGSKINTPNIDEFAAEGMRFTDMHAPSSVCTPSRYGILTGDYCWRSRLPQSVLQGYGRALIEPGQPTVASLLKNHDYSTAVVGKWHLGLNWVIKPGHDSVLQLPVNDPDHARIVKDIDPGNIDFSLPVTDGPREHGFDYSYILPASLDMEPYCYLQNDTLTEPLTSTTNGNNLHPKGTPEYATGAFWRPGLMSPHFDFNSVLPNCTDHAVNYIKQKAKSGKPFFLYFAMPAPHTPWLPAKEFIGKSKAGPYGDYVTEVDAMVGKVLQAIKESGAASNTIVIFTSDNGPYWRPQYIQKYQHHAAYIFRGMKADAWEGGHRVPFIVRWPGHVKAGSVSNLIATLANLMATSAELAGGDKMADSSFDSYSLVPVLTGKADSSIVQKAIINESSHGLYAVRNGSWKLIEGLGSGGFSSPVTAQPGPGEAIGQLYNINTDPSETNNLYLQDPGKVDSLSHLMDSIKKLKH